MAKRIEIEKKFYLKNIEKLIKIIEENNLMFAYNFIICYNNL